MYYIKAKVTVKIFGISYPQEHTVSHLVETYNPDDARVKFEEYMKKKFAPNNPTSIKFEYIEVASPIK